MGSNYQQPDSSPGELDGKRKHHLCTVYAVLLEIRKVWFNKREHWEMNTNELCLAKPLPNSLLIAIEATYSNRVQMKPY